MFSLTSRSRRRAVRSRPLLAALAIAGSAGAASADVRYTFQPAVEPTGTSTSITIAITDEAYLARTVSLQDLTGLWFTSAPGIGISSTWAINNCNFQLSTDRTKIDSGSLTRSFISTLALTFGHAAGFDNWSYNSMINNEYDRAGSGDFVVAGPGDFARTVPGPAGIATSVTPRFAWSESHTAATYAITIASDVTMANIVHAAAHLTETAYTPPAGVLKPGVQYYWQVTATNIIGSTPAADPTGTAGPGLFVVGLPIGEVNPCPADFNQSGAVTVQDLFDYLAAFFAGCP